jgi:hypothetical protein
LGIFVVMPFRFDIKPAPDLLYLKASGKVTGRNILRCLRTYAAKPAFHPRIDTLLDVKADAKIEPGDDEVMDALAEATQEARDQKHYRVACAARNREHRIFFQTAAATLAPTAQVHTFSGLPGALSWLGHERADLSPLDLKSGAPGR